jgi:hypothetical protein
MASTALSAVPGLEYHVARAVVNAAHQTCPCSKATRGNIDVDEFLVFVDFGSGRDENGQITGRFPGSHCAYVVSKQGSITRIDGGL